MLLVRFAMMRKIALGAAAAIAFAMNPAFVGCGGNDLSYSFGAKEMSAAVAGTWTLTGHGKTHTFTLAQKTANVNARATSAFFREAAACSHRTLVASAAACADSTDMPLLVTFADGTERMAQATLVVFGFTFTQGMLNLVIDGIDVTAWIKPDGTIERMSESATLVHTH